MGGVWGLLEEKEEGQLLPLGCGMSVGRTPPEVCFAGLNPWSDDTQSSLEACLVGRADMGQQHLHPGQGES